MYQKLITIGATYHVRFKNGVIAKAVLTRKLTEDEIPPRKPGKGDWHFTYYEGVLAQTVGTFKKNHKFPVSSRSVLKLAGPPPAAVKAPKGEPEPDAKPDAGDKTNPDRLNDEQCALLLKTYRANDKFAMDLVAAYEGGVMSPKQRTWFYRLANRAAREGMEFVMPAGATKNLPPMQPGKIEVMPGEPTLEILVTLRAVKPDEISMLIDLLAQYKPTFTIGREI